MRTLCRLLLIIWCGLLVVSVVHGAQFARTYGIRMSDRGAFLGQAANSGYLVAASAGGDDKVSVLELDANGNLVWARSLGTDQPGTREHAYLVQSTRDGGYVVLGKEDTYSSSCGPCTSTWLLRLDRDGNVLSTRRYAGMSVASSQATLDGGFIAAGYACSVGVGALCGATVLKFDADGNATWGATIGGASANSAQLTSDGGYIVAGNTRSAPAGNSSAWLLKLDAAGNIVWQKAFGGSDNYYAASVQPTADGGYVVAGYIDQWSSLGVVAWVLKLDVSGNIVWQKAYAPSGVLNFVYAWSVQPSADGGYLVVGSDNFQSGGWPVRRSDAWVMKLDAGGNIVWQRAYRASLGDDDAWSVQPSPDGGYVVAATSSSFSSSTGGGVDLWLLKLDANGAIGGCANMWTWNARPLDTGATGKDTTATAVPYTLNPVEGSVLTSRAITAAGAAQQCYDPSPASRLTAVEYYYRSFDHYFLTTLPQEIAAVDAGAFPGWTRTGKSFQVYGLDPAAASVCRFWSGQTFAPKSSHFYTPYAAECAYLKQQGVWQYEGDVFGLGLPAGPPGQGTCGTATQPLYRAYNNGMSGAPNHRYTTDPTVLDAMIAQGWSMEGEASTRVFACVPTQQ